MKKIFKFFFIFFITISAYSQEISWESLSSEDDKIIFKTNLDAISKKLNSTINDINSLIKLPINDFNFEEFNLNREFKFINENKINIQLYRGTSKNLKDKVFINVIGEIITITIIQENKRLHLSNAKNKNEFIFKEIDTTNELDKINLENDIINHSENSLKKKKQQQLVI